MRPAALLCTLLLAALPLGGHAQSGMRIVSLMPSLTEDLFALGAGDEIVAVSAFTDRPAAARALPHVASSTSIDAEKIVALHPDLVVGIPFQAAMVAPLRRARLHVVLLPDDSFRDIYATLQELGTLVHRSAAAAALEHGMREQTAALERTVSRRRKPSVFVVLDVAPIYTVGKRSYINTLIEMAGGRNAARADLPYIRYSAEALLADQPDVLVVDPMVKLKSVENREPWRSLHAVQSGNVAQIPDTEALLSPGPRYNDGLRWLISVLRRVDGVRHSDNTSNHG
ncbi:MAG: ABC transporter substrate-binding protein [Candidatus Eremiobacteraeota bacterium]|nr:ABC transporter substrate-binding protein [Candidatus Eremiobacteraeota bacterium]MBV8583149.1 ABC transporter substrate-binding protein [Candidatus Eremiobacteraeota bacterium]